MTNIAKGSEISSLLDRTRDARIGDDTPMQCKVCWYVYRPAEGCPEHQIPPNTPFKSLPSWWTCPGCDSPRDFFIVFDEADR